MLIVSIITTLIICLVLTIVIEYIPIVCFLHISKKYFIATNILTNVLANIVIIIYDILNMNKSFIINRWQLIIVLEIIVFVSEIVLYYIYLGEKHLLKTILLTILANALSAGMGSYILSNKVSFKLFI